MHTSRIAIVGAGLAGLYAAFLLEQRGITDYVVLEARARVGGRIASLWPDENDTMEAFDLGPSWYWPELQHSLEVLVKSLGLTSFAQYETGDMIVERSHQVPPVRMQGFVNQPPSMRLRGGMQALIDALRQRIGSARIYTGQAVYSMSLTSSGSVELGCAGGQRYTAQHVLLAVPPRLAAQSVTFSPSLPERITQQWASTATWMAPQAKYVALYPTPFWREDHLSGEARSLMGPLGEIHDASHPDGHGALFGFFSLPARARAQLGDEALRQHCRAQLARLFGPQASSPEGEVIRDWAQELFTATDADQMPSEHHSMAPSARAEDGAWQPCLIGIGSEWGEQYAGYLAGAIEAAERGVADVLAQ
ncbi:FAD-dependent oxidoreductase [Halomonas sp. CUBES01]|uniref:FAD-dependent oxidoreductase n=1 Tax=Vreelandella gomseomensis TaxID=370766 RepID=A0ABU1GH53_9GAMM|nr:MULTISPECIES: FAD-dependent oxidoreductase [Halomonas]MDR5876657.1 FAD-dependent oxidoreductase [Halomonas gomseomensis]MEC4768752.1 FAD-dependent oxidoreductase [Halomonas sp. CUBES01]